MQATKDPAVGGHPLANGLGNHIVGGTARRYQVEDFAGALSIKSVLQGRAVWTLGRQRFVVPEGSYLVVNDRQTYSIEIESAIPVTTFCLFFARGLVEACVEWHRTPNCDYLDDPRPGAQPGQEFENFVWPQGSTVFAELQKFAGNSAGPSVNRQDDWFMRIADCMAREHGTRRSAPDALPLLKPAARAEVYRRLLRGRDYLLADGGDVRLPEVARVAGLSPFHFHRLFRAAFRQTPHQFLMEERLRRAARLLARAKCPVLDIALECGWASLPSFTTAFRRWSGWSPAAYRRQQNRKIR